MIKRFLLIFSILLLSVTAYGDTWKYKIYCESGDGWQEVEQGTETPEPSACPINGGHTVTAGSVSLIEYTGEGGESHVHTESDGSEKGFIPAADKTKLDGIESSATADQTGAEIKTAYEAEADTNAYTDSEKTKLTGIEASADVTDATNVAAAGAIMSSEKGAANGVATLDGSTLVPDAQIPSAIARDSELHTQSHAIGGADHSSDTLANVNGKISDATLIDTGDSRLSDSRAPTGTAGGDLGGTYPNPTVDDGADSTAIHDNVSGEINAITEKVSPANGDWLIVEDSAASNVKKKVQVGNLPGIGSDKRVMAFSWVLDKNSPYLYTSSGTYEVQARFIFPGTNNLGTPSGIYGASYVSSGQTGKYKIYDLTNGQTICEDTSVTATTISLEDCGTISNLPTARAIWELQATVTGGGANKIYINGVTVEF